MQDVTYGPEHEVMGAYLALFGYYQLDVNRFFFATMAQSARALPAQEIGRGDVIALVDTTLTVLGEERLDAPRSSPFLLAGVVWALASKDKSVVTYADIERACRDCVGALTAQIASAVK